ncbi:DNA-processing protein DprA [Tropicimonas sp. S265A]|uniref:DNA-processing protein DprA n=1 Tax=Tropicimonas sp. S265A TaxID=3415134 RepID=UPI003C7E4DA3
MARDDAPQQDMFASELRTHHTADAHDFLGFAPPASEDEALDWLQLIRSPRIGPTTFLKLLRKHRSARRALDALPDSAWEAGLRDYRPAERQVAEREYRAGQKLGAHLLALSSVRYSAQLSQINDPPPLLWCLGDVGLMTRECIGIAGARNASSLGMRLTRALAKGLGSEGAVIVSGVARGIDRTAHEAALETGTIGVLAGGVDVIYPRENTDIYEKMREDGLLISEQPPGMQPQARHFPRRNRLISGLSLGIVIPEAATKSGSLITARDASDQGREVMAVPGHPFDARAAGCNQLLREGATLIRNADDVLDALRPLVDAPQPGPVEGDAMAPRRANPTASNPDSRPPPPDQIRARILAHLGAAPLPEDQLIRDLVLPAAAATSALVELEMAGRVIRHPGGALSLGG